METVKALPLTKSRRASLSAWQRFLKDRWAVAALLFLAVLAVVLVVGPAVAPHDPLKTNLGMRLKPPGTPGYPLGTDELGRDVLSRLLYGARPSIGVGFAAVGVAMLVGVPIGLLAGYFGGLLDTVVSRIVDVLLAFPYVLLAIAIVAALGPGLFNAMLAVGIAGVPYYVRIVRASALALRDQEFIQASRALGAGHGRILFRHVLPNALSPLIVAATLDVGWMITAAAGLSFLGLGAQPPQPEWGVMLSDGRQYVGVAPHLALVPGFAIFSVVLALNLVGDGLRDALDPRLRGVTAQE
ncbi:ABC transporter permease [Thermomicrobium roseum]|uniref:Oligopeptide ABC transporter permease protein n=1 Tax=Thermomicrobium roseum (strain ATCC 27502 / DSM 5159 / P-2) TaxID=309801 RepID=B9L4I7_THERP|nr:ABC transporter permease [Thermomicrobium roseum]ACM06732.1 oligopeptide ABC transporter permease protein [Thermomicrobium roseum DSM 5159]